jgi:hypothetical protein
MNVEVVYRPAAHRSHLRVEVREAARNVQEAYHRAMAAGAPDAAHIDLVRRSHIVDC